MQKTMFFLRLFLKLQLLLVMWTTNGYHDSPHKHKYTFVSASDTSGDAESAGRDGGGGIFNHQVEMRVKERLAELMNTPVKMAGLVERISDTVLFEPPFFRPHQRDVLFSVLWGIEQEYGHGIYYGQEDGMFLGATSGSGWYLEGRGTNGYYVRNDPNINGNGTSRKDQYTKRLYYNHCIDENKTLLDENTNVAENCTLEEGDEYVACIDECRPVPCPSSRAELFTESLSNNTSVNTIVYCPEYEILKVSASDTMGYIPSYGYCLDNSGKFVENNPPNSVVSPSFMKDGICTYGGGKITVNGKLPSKDTYAMADRRNYLFLKGYDADVDDEAAAASLYSEDPGVIDDSQKSDDIFVGGHKTRRYEPRLRPWYKGAREFQNDFWTKPYVYADPGIFGITFARPLYYIDPSTGHKVFRGCIGVDHDLNTISDFLRSKFLLDGLSNGQRNQTEVREEDERVSSGNAIVLIVEDAEPYEIIGSSTDSKVFTSVLKTNPNIVCEPTDLDIDACDTTRLTPEEYAQTGNSSQDWIISTAFEAQKKQNFTRNLVKSLSRPPTESVSEEDYEEGASDYYVSQSLLYTPAIGGSFLQWRIIVAMPVEIDKDDAILSGDPMFVMVLVVTLTSSVCCLFLFYCYFRQRNRAEVAISDWRFTSAFLMGCAILNLTPLTYLGPITDAKCMAQMWALHLVFIIAMAPLLVKVWRIYKLVSSATRARRLSISNQKAMLFTLPFILFQVLMLTLASIFDPPRKENAVEISGSASIQRLFCGHQKHVFSITQAIYLGGLTICGCVLAYKSRNLGSSVGEAKQMFFAMYNIALVALIVMVSWYTLKIDNKSFYITMTLGICWGTVFSGAAFVLPRLLKIKENEKTNSERKTRLEISHDQSDN